MVDLSFQYDYPFSCTYDYFYNLLYTAHNLFHHHSIEFDESSFFKQFFSRYIFDNLELLFLDPINILINTFRIFLILHPSSFGNRRSVFLRNLFVSSLQDHLSPPSLHYRTLRLTLPPRRLDLWEVLGETKNRRIEFWSAPRSTRVLGWSVQVHRYEIEENFTRRRGREGRVSDWERLVEWE